MSRPTLQGDLVILVPATVDHSERFAEIIEEPGVKEWWREFDIDLGNLDPETEATTFGEYVFAVEYDGLVVGLIQYSEETEPDYRHASVDIAIHTDWHNRGIGSDALRTLAQYLFTERDHHRLEIDPAADNVAAIAAYKRVGFKPVGITRQSERGLDGTWHDSLLMDLLRGELR